MVQELIKLYNKDYVIRFEFIHRPRRFQRTLQYMQLGSNFIVADYGCGSGLLYPHLEGKIESYQGVDISSDFIETANNHKKNLGWQKAYFYCEPIQSFCESRQNIFDAGFAFDFSEHVPDEEWVDILLSINMSLKPGGKLYLHTPNAQYFIEIMKRRNLLIKQISGHVAVRDAEKNVKMLKKAGFAKIKVGFIPHYNPFLSCWHILSKTPWVGKYFFARLFIIAEKSG